jgi:ribonuclease T1
MLTSRSRLLCRLLLALTFLMPALLAQLPARAVPAAAQLADSAGLPALQDLGAEERASVLRTLALIDAGGPFPYHRDGIIFSNREGLLPAAPRGFYHEYTVPTTGAPDRGARRIVTGADGTAYYTRDHYASFRRLR